MAVPYSCALPCQQIDRGILGRMNRLRNPEKVRVQHSKSYQFIEIWLTVVQQFYIPNPTSLHALVSILSLHLYMPLYQFCRYVVLCCSVRTYMEPTKPKN